MSLVEVLVALLVISIGMLGVALLFVQGVRGSRSALLRTQAVNLVSDMADRIRANANAGPAYDLGAWDGAPRLHGCAPTETSPAGSNCTIEELAEDDLARWLESVRLTLPALTDDAAPADVEYFAGAGGQPDRYRVSVRWQEPGAAAAGAAAPEPLSYAADVLIMPRPPVLAAAPAGP